MKKQQLTDNTKQMEKGTTNKQNKRNMKKRTNNNHSQKTKMDQWDK